MIKANFIEESDLQKIKELKRFLSKKQMRIGAEEIIISFYGTGGHRWYYLGLNFHKNKWKIRTSMEIMV